MSRRRLSVVPIAVALVVAAALADYPSSARAGAVPVLLFSLGLLFLATRGRRWAVNTLAYFSSVGAVLFLLAGAWQLDSDPRYFLRGVALGVAAFLLIRARGVSAPAA